MTPKQVQSSRDKINAAWERNDRAAAERLQAKLHAHFVAAADRYVNSAAGEQHMAYMMGRP